MNVLDRFKAAMRVFRTKEATASRTLTLNELLDWLEETGEFTINVPLNGCDKNILTVCGTKSGRDMDKIKELGLTLEAPEVISVPAIKELPLTLECKVIYKQDQDPEAINEENTKRFYPRNEQFPQGDYHTVYYGQIVAAYIVE